MWEAIYSFDKLAIAQQDTMSPLSEPPFSSHHLTQPRLSGFTREFNSPDVSCLDTRVRCVTQSTHAPHHRQYDTMPAQLNELLPGFTQALRGDARTNAKMQAYIHTYIHKSIHEYIQTYMPEYVRTNIHTYLHSYLHTHTQMRRTFSLKSD